MAEEIENLVVRLSFDNAGFQNGVSGINRSLKLVQAEFKASTAQLKDFGKGTDGFKLQAESLTKQITLQKQKIEALRKSLQQSVDAKGADAKATQNLAIKTNKEVEALAKMEHQLTQTNEKLKNQTSGWSQFSAKINDSGQKMRTLGRGMEDLGQSLTFGLTVPLAGVAFGATKAAVDFETAFTGVRKTVNATDEEFNTLENQIREMSKTIPSSASDIASIAESAGQLGIQTPAILGFTKTMIDLGNSTNLTADEASNALARLANITQMPQTEFDRLGSTIVALGNAGASTESEITDMGLRLAGAGHQVGMTVPQIVSFASALSSVGIEAEAGGTAFSRVFLNIQTAVKSGSKNLIGFAQVAGMSAADFKKAYEKDAAGAIIAFIGGLGKLQKNGADVATVLANLGLGEIRVRDALLRASGAGDLFKQSLELGSKAWKENTALTNEASKRYATTASQMEIFKNKITDVGIDLGQALIPALMDTMDALDPVVQGIKDGAKWFSELDPRVQRVIIGFGAAAAAGGPLLMVLGPMTAGIGAMSVAFTAAEVSMSAVLGPIGLVIGGLTALGVAVFAFSGNQKDLGKVSLDTANSMIKQHDANAQLIDSFDALRVKSQLTNDEFARYLDIQSQLKTASDPKTIDALQQELENLQKKSGLSNEQLAKMVSLNQDITDKMPQATKQITEQGNRIADTTDKLKKYNQELADASIRELEMKRLEALKKQRDVADELAKKQKAYNNNLKVEQTMREQLQNWNQQAVDARKEELETLIKQHASNKELVKTYQIELDQLNKGKEGLQDQLLKVMQRNVESKNEIENLKEASNKLDAVNQKLAEQLLVQGGINQAIADEAIKKGTVNNLIDTTVAKLQSQKQALIDSTPPAQRNTQEFQNAVGAIDSQIARLQAAKSKINEMTGAAETFNETMASPIEKEIKIRQIYEDVYGKGGNGHQVPVGYASGTDFAPGGMAWVGERGPELMFVPRGSQIIPHDKSMQIASQLNIPMLAKGADIIKSGLALVGERGRELFRAPAGTTSLSNTSSSGVVYNIMPGAITLDMSKLKDIRDVIDLLNKLVPTARQYGIEV